jgi:hypothetical protein
MKIFVNLYSTCRVVEINMQIETWIARNYVNGVYWFHFSHLITVLALAIKLTCAYDEHHLSKSSIVCLIGRYTDNLY